MAGGSQPTVGNQQDPPAPELARRFAELCQTARAKAQVDRGELGSPTVAGRKRGYGFGHGGIQVARGVAPVSRDQELWVDRDRENGCPSPCCQAARDCTFESGRGYRGLEAVGCLQAAISGPWMAR